MGLEEKNKMIKTLLSTLSPLLNSGKFENFNDLINI